MCWEYIWKFLRYFYSVRLNEVHQGQNITRFGCLVVDYSIYRYLPDSFLTLEHSIDKIVILRSRALKKGGGDPLQLSAATSATSIRI